MIKRLGNVMYGLGIFVALLCANKAINDNDADFAFAALIAILIGWSLRYIFAAKKSIIPWK